MKHQILSWALAFLVGMCVALPANAVTVNIDIKTEGEPVPGASISFRTPGGEDVPVIQITAVTEQEDPKREVEKDPPPTRDQEDTSGADRPANDDKPKRETNRGDDDPNGGGYQVEVPDDFVGQDLIIVVSKDNEVVKRDPVRVGRDTSRVSIEAYDPVDAGLSIQLSQPKKCRRGKICDYLVKVQNGGAGIYKGPLFLTGVLHGTLLGSGKEGDWQCAYSGRGKQICHNQVSLQPGAKQSWSLGFRLPKRMSQRASNCLQIDVFDRQASGRVNPLLMAVQLGLAERGFQVGRPDGIMGPRTEAAMQQFAERNGGGTSEDLSGMFEALFGISPDRLGRLGISSGKNCQRVALFSPPRAAKRVSKTRRRRPQYRDDDDDFDDDRDDDYDPAVDIGIGIGLGLLNNRLHRGRRHERRRERLDD